MEQADGPLSIRQLAEQSFNMREQNKMQQKRSNQHNTVLFKRSIDPVISHNRKKTPLNGIKRMTRDGLIGTNNDDDPVLLNKDEENEEVGEEEQQQNNNSSQLSDEKSSSAIMFVGVGAGIIFLCIILALAFG